MASAPVSPGGARRRWRAVHAFFAVAVVTGGTFFVLKLFAFLKTIKRDELAGFAYDPILVYGTVAAGFLFLLAWAFLSGQFRDLEKTKKEMLERFDEQERAERAAEGHDVG